MDSLLFSFNTSKGRTRTFSIPHPRALSSIDAAMVDSVRAAFIQNSIFDDTTASGAPTGLSRCVHQDVAEVALF